jgi:hypothetical protein
MKIFSKDYKPNFPKDWLELDSDGTGLYVREVSDKEMGEFQKACFDNAGKPKHFIRAKSAILSCVDDNNERIWQDKDLELVQSLPTSILQKIWDKFLSINKIGKDDADELEKN